MSLARLPFPAFRPIAGPQASLGSLIPFWAAALVGVLSGALTGYWATLPAVIVLWAAWKYLQTEEGPPVLALAFTHHWTQITLGLFYFPIFSRPLMRFGNDDPGYVTWLALVGATALLLGLIGGLRLAKPADPYYRNRPEYFFNEAVAVALFLAFVATSSALGEIAFDYPR